VWTIGLLKEAATLDIASPDTCLCLNLPFEPFTSLWIHPCYNQPRVSKPKFRLETNSTVVWLYAGGVSLILPDVWFGTVSLDYVTHIYIYAPLNGQKSFWWVLFVTFLQVKIRDHSEQSHHTQHMQAQLNSVWCILYIMFKIEKW